MGLDPVCVSASRQPEVDMADCPEWVSLSSGLFGQLDLQCGEPLDHPAPHKAKLREAQGDSEWAQWMTRGHVSAWRHRAMPTLFSWQEPRLVTSRSLTWTSIPEEVEVEVIRSEVVEDTALQLEGGPIDKDVLISDSNLLDLKQSFDFRASPPATDEGGAKVNDGLILTEGGESDA